MNLPLPDDASVRRPRVHRSPARLTVCVLLLLGILAEMVMIFLFSNEDKTQSGDRSDKVTEAIAPVVVPGYEKLLPRSRRRSWSVWECRCASWRT